jgi:alpha-N-arabinofuranosidase
MKKLVLLAFIFSTIFAFGQLPTFKISKKVIADIDDKLFGQFMEKPSWDGEIGGDGAIDKKTGSVSPDVLAYLKEMKIPIIRYPGGTDVDYYQWYNLIDNVPGKHQKRPAYRNYSGTGKITSDNRLGLDAFLTLCSELKSEPLLVVNIGDAFFRKISIEESAKNAAGFVAYCNSKVGTKVSEGMPDWPAIRAKNGHTKPYNVRYFEIGNEIQLFKSMKEKDVNDSLVNHYVNCLEAIVNAMLDVDPNIKIITDGEIKEVSEQIKRRLGNKISYLACHYYLPWEINTVKLDTTTIDIKSLSQADIWNAWVATPYIHPETGQSYFPKTGKYNNVADAGYDLAITEWNWNGWWNKKILPDAALNSLFAKGIGAAGFIHAMMRDAGRMKIGCQSMLVGNVWDINAIRVDTTGKMKARFFPTGKVTTLYSKYHGNQLLEMSEKNQLFYTQPYKMNSIEAVPRVTYVDALASRNETTLYISFINRNFANDMDVEIDLSDFKTDSKYKQHIFTTNDMITNELGYFEDKTEKVKNHKPLIVHLPKHSLSIFEIKIF